MYNTRIAPISRGVRLIAPAVQRPHAYAYARAISTVGPRAAALDPTRPTSAGTEVPKRPQNKNALYIGGGLVGLVGAIWYYYGMGDQKESLGRQKVRCWF